MKKSEYLYTTQDASFDHHELSMTVAFNCHPEATKGGRRIRGGGDKYSCYQLVLNICFNRIYY